MRILEQMCGLRHFYFDKVDAKQSARVRVRQYARGWPKSELKSGTKSAEMNASEYRLWTKNRRRNNWLENFTHSTFFRNGGRIKAVAYRRTKAVAQFL